MESAGLLSSVRTFSGYNSRLKRVIGKNGERDTISEEPSSHSFGIAFDINSEDPGNGASVAAVAPVFERYGFKWGKAFNDPMHFEVERFMTPEEIAAIAPISATTATAPKAPEVTTQQLILNRTPTKTNTS